MEADRRTRKVTQVANLQEALQAGLITENEYRQCLHVQAMEALRRTGAKDFRSYNQGSEAA